MDTQEPWLGPEATVTDVAAPPEKFSGTAVSVEPYPTVRLTAFAVGAASGETLFDAAEAGPVPAELVAVTVKL